MIILLSFLALSCSNLERSLKESEVEDARLALSALVEDISKETDSLVIPLSSLRSSLQNEYLSYREYDPRYDEREAEYLESLSAMLSSMSSGLFPYIRERLLGFELDPYVYIYSSASLVDAFRRANDSDLKDYFYRYVLSRQSELRSAFTESEREFSSIKRVMENLERAGKSVDLSYPEPILFSSLSDILYNSVFSYLIERENEIKSSEENRGSDIYDIFWRINGRG